MKNVFLASVGQADAYVRKGDKLELFFSAKTLTDSAINTSVSAEEVRGGQGAALLGQFFHTSQFGLNMTDAVFHLEYLAAQVGSEIEAGGFGLEDITLSKADFVDGKYTLKKAPIEILEGTGHIVWFNLSGKNEYSTVEVEDDGVTVDLGAEFIASIPADTKICLHYYADKAAARHLIVRSDFMPKELVLVLNTRLFAAEAMATESGKPVGGLVVKIPRFQLNGTVDLSMAMSSAATVSLQGTAFGYSDDCEGSKYAEIIEYYNEVPFDGYDSLVALDDSDQVGETLVLYAADSNAKKVPELFSAMYYRSAAFKVYPDGALDVETGKVLEDITGISYTTEDGRELTYGEIPEEPEEPEVPTSNEVTALTSASIGGKTYNFSALTVTENPQDTYTLTGDLAKATSAELTELGFEAGVTALFAIKVDLANATKYVLKGGKTKTVNASQFEGKTAGAEYDDLILSGNTKNYTITVTYADSTTKTITIVNDAEIAA